MKKLGKVLRILLAVLMVLVLLFCAYIFFVLNHHFLVDMRSLAPVSNRYSQRLIQVEDGVKFIVDDGYVVFNADRQVVEAVGVTPIDFDRRNCWGLWSYEAFVAEYGSYHEDIGDNVFWPAWITDDGYWITMWAAGSVRAPFGISNYGEVAVYDLLAVQE